MKTRTLFATCLWLAACGEGDSSERSAPFAPQPDTSEGLTNVSSDLNALLENGELEGACDRYFSGEDESRRGMLLCGKSMFFDEPFDSIGAPTALIDFMVDEMGDQVGEGFSGFGLIPDPRTDNRLPFGLAPSASDTHSYTCAACHLDQLPDGRYALGGANHDYEYGKLTLALGVFPGIALQGGEEALDPAAREAIQPLLDAVEEDPSLTQRLLSALLPVLGAGGGSAMFPEEAQRHHANWLSGTMDFLIEPLPFSDDIHVISKMSALWGLPSEKELEAFGLESAMFGWTGGTADLTQFEHGFIVFGGGSLESWPDERLTPLREFLETLRAPENPDLAPKQQRTKGEELFAERGCLDCHDGPRGMGLELYTFEEIGTDDAMKLWLDPEDTGEPCCDLPEAITKPGELVTHRIKAPRLTGLWTMERFLHNGSVGSLEELFCVDGPRGDIEERAYGNGGHDYTCDDLSDDEKKALIAYLNSL